MAEEIPGNPGAAPEPGGEGDSGGRSRIRGTVAAIVAVVLLLLFLHSVAEILLLLFIAVLFSIYLGLLADTFQDRMGVGRGAAVALGLGVTVAGLWLLGLVIVPPVAAETQALFRTLPDQLMSLEQQLRELAEESVPFGQLLGPLPEEGPGYVASIMQEIRGYVADLVPYLFSGFRFLIHLFSVLAMGIYLSVRPGVYQDGLVSLFPPRHRGMVRQILEDLSQTLRAWIVGQILAMTVLGVLTWIGLVVLGVPYAMAFGVFTGLAAIVPFFGAIVATLLPAVIVLGTSGVLKALAVVLLGIVIHLVEANFVAPVIMERKVDLPPVLTLLSVLVMASLLEIIGLLVAVPVLASTIVLVRRVYVQAILEGKITRPADRAEPVDVDVPPEVDVLVHPLAETSLPSLLERR